ncbi:MAG TPA: YbhB/YbcL family Raf kinase inhibitor-like protein [Devosiaceae bacterium]|nr:YbhB/YbcL family Raf kinase inhibitor-like protein [Devosiaceae bacterium]
MKLLALAAVLALAATPSWALSLKSTDVSTGKTFATQLVCPKYEGSSVSPELSWSGVPHRAKSLAISMYDPDAKTPDPKVKGHWHWLLVDIPTSTTSLAQGIASQGGALPTGMVSLPNGAGHAAYDGPCPPPGNPHHYQITLYALPEASLDAAAIVTAADTTAEQKAAAIGAYLHKHAIARARITPEYGTK